MPPKAIAETLEITLSNDNHYHLEIIRDRHWYLEDVEENMIIVSAMEGDGSGKPNFISPLVLTKAANVLILAMTTFQVVSVHQRVNVVVTIDAVEITRNWIDWRLPTESDLLSLRAIYMTILPNVQVYRETAGSDEKIYLVSTTETLITANPLVKNIQISVANNYTTLANRNIHLDETNDYKHHRHDYHCLSSK